jgi:hypothetical protein
VAKKTKPKIKLPVPVMPTPVDWAGPVQTRNIVKSKTAESRFVLDDGTELTVKVALVDVKRALKQYNQYGQPLYFCSIVNTVDTKAPSKLLKPKLK